MSLGFRNWKLINSDILFTNFVVVTNTRVFCFQLSSRQCFNFYHLPFDHWFVLLLFSPIKFCSIAYINRSMLFFSLVLANANTCLPAVKLSSMTGAISLAAVRILLSASLLICLSKACRLSVRIASRTIFDSGSSCTDLKDL